MNRILSFVCLACLMPFMATATPGGLRLGLSQAGLEADPGDTVVSCQWDGTATCTLSRAVCPWVEIGASMSKEELFGLSMQFALPVFAYPVVLGGAAERGRGTFLSSLHLGPVRIDASRSWGTDPSRIATLRFSAQPFFAMVVGIEEKDGRAGGLAGIELHRGPWGASFLVGRAGWRVECGGVLR